MTVVTPNSQQRSTDAALRERAARVVPGGMWGHMNVARLPAAYPQFFARSEGCRLWDVDGRDYIDFMCAFGPMITGYGDPVVEAAAEAQRTQGDLMNGPGEVMVTLAEKLVGLVAHADWAIFAKNGADATTTCVTLARATTKRRKIMVARGSYHGALPWCSPSLAGVTAEDRAHLVHFDYNDPASVAAAAAEAGDDLAGVLVTAYQHNNRIDQALPTAEFAQAVRTACDRVGAALILDDVRAGFRLNLAGSWEDLGVRPDLSAFSKAIANGYPLSAVVGTDRFREAAQQIFVTGSFWCGAVAMAAAVATLDRLQALDAPAVMTRAGLRLREGIAAQAKALGVALRQSGPPQMPLILFDGDDAKFTKGNVFVAEALAHGVYLHPWHNMFLSTAHTDADIDRALAGIEPALAAVKRQFGG